MHLVMPDMGFEPVRMRGHGLALLYMLSLLTVLQRCCGICHIHMNHMLALEMLNYLLFYTI